MPPPTAPRVSLAKHGATAWAAWAPAQARPLRPGRVSCPTAAGFCLGPSRGAKIGAKPGGAAAPVAVSPARPPAAVLLRWLRRETGMRAPCHTRAQRTHPRLVRNARLHAQRGRGIARAGGGGRVGAVCRFRPGADPRRVPAAPIIRLCGRGGAAGAGRVRAGFGAPRGAGVTAGHSPMM